MSDTNSQNVWDAASKGSSDTQNAAENEYVNDQQESVSNPDVVDAVATEVKPKSKFKVIYIIALIGGICLGFFGYIGYSLYSKMFAPQTQTDIMVNNAILADTTSVPSSATSAAQNGAQQTLPVGDGTTPTDVPSQANASVVVESNVPSAVVVAAAAAPAVTNAVSSLTPAQAATCPPVGAAPVCAATSSSSGTSERLSTKRFTGTSTTQKARPKTKPQVAAVKSSPAVGLSQDLGRLTGYKVLAIEPKSGDHQQAWIRGHDGKIHIVREGDALLGARVTSVRFVDGAVKTTAGDIRK